MLSNIYPPIATGSTSQIVGLADELRRRGHKVIVITSRLSPNSPKLEEADGLLVYRLPAFQLPRMKAALNFAWLNYTYTPGNILRVDKILERHKPDVLHLHNHMFDMAFHAVRASRRYHLPLAISIHTIITHPKPFYNWFLQAVDRSLLKHCVVRRADVLMCADWIVADYISKAFGKKTAVIVNYGVEPLPKPKTEEMLTLRQKYNLGEGPIILSLGHLHENRDRRELIGILPQLTKSFPNIKVIIVGDIGTRSTENLAIHLGVRDHLVLTDAVPHSEVSAYIGLADIEMHWFDPNHPHRTIGPSGLEVMGAGKVLVSIADKDIFGEGVLQDGKNIILIDLSQPDKMVKRLIAILSNKEERNRIGDRARETLQQHFNWEIIGDQTLEVYRRLLKVKTTGGLSLST